MNGFLPQKGPLTVTSMQLGAVEGVSAFPAENGGATEAVCERSIGLAGWFVIYCLWP